MIRHVQLQQVQPLVDLSRQAHPAHQLLDRPDPY